MEGVHGISAVNTNCTALDVYGCESADTNICMNNWSHQLDCIKNKIRHSTNKTNKEKLLLRKKEKQIHQHVFMMERNQSKLMSQDTSSRLSLHKY
jgi:hypothetical protein